MGLPSHRRTKSSKKRRASHFALSRVQLTSCQSCGKPVLQHHVCLSCGTYQGRKVVAVVTKGEKKLRKREKAKAKTEKEDVKEAAA